MSGKSVHDEWLSLIEVSGPFLAVPVLNEAFPQGLEALDGTKKRRIRQAYEEWIEALENEDPQLPALHTAWIEEVLSKGLELDEHGSGDNLKRKDWCTDHLHVSLVEHSVTLAPDFAVVDSQNGNKPLLLIHAYPQNTDLDKSIQSDGWASSPADRMVQLCRASACRLGLVTNGERWMLVDAPVGASTTFASWYARIWNQEPVTLQALFHLLGIRRFFVDESEQLPALFDRSLKFQDEVTDALGEQVRRAVEVLIQTLDKADQDRNRELLHDVKEPVLYEAALTVMMRLVFLLSAEERGLLLMGDERYEANYALSTLRMQLRKESEEILERRWDAWSRLLAIFRAVYGGIEHENLRLPALGGSLFDPDRFPFLEGRAKGSNWRTDVATPLPIDNRTVLLLLEAIQQFQGRTLSYHELDVEQIGYVYEGLLERTVRRTEEVTLELDATKTAKTPWIKLAELDSASLNGVAQLAELLQERSGSSASRVQNDLAKPVDDTLADRLLTACHGDTKLRDRVKPYAHLLRTDPWGYPLVYPAGAFIVTTGSDRRETGTHYTPKSLTEAIVTETLTPVVYVGPSEGTPRDQWALKSPAELLELKICDPAMGSGAFLVQACRWLSERLVEAWSQVEATGKTVSVDGEVLDAGAATEPLPRESEARTVIASRLIAERCLYGVDLNPLAVELAKLSIWLVTLAKGRPFGFLDHNLRSGNSLLGIHRLDQLTEFSMTPNGKGQRRLFGQSIERAVREAIKLRQQLREMPIRDIQDVEAMAHLDADARRRLELSESIADAFVGDVFATGLNTFALETGLAALAILAEQAVDSGPDSLDAIRRRSHLTLSTDLPADKPARQPFHWPLEFPEVFARERGGFDVMVGNPPFLGGQRITGVAGTAFRDWLVAHIAEGRRGSADLVAYFFLRSWTLLREGGGFGLLAVNTIAEGDTRQVGLEAMLSAGAVIYAAYPNEPWPGKAAVITSRVHLHKGQWSGKRSLLGRPAPFISAFLSDREEWSPKRLKTNEGLAYQGSIVLGMGFVLLPDQASMMLDADSRNAEVIFPYINGDDLNSDPEQKPSRWVINFWDWPETKAKTYTLPYKWLGDNVKAERLANKDKGAREKWWLFLRARSELYHAIGRGRNFERHPENWCADSPLENVIAISRHTKYFNPVLIPNTAIASDATVVLALEDFAHFAWLNSTIVQVWVQKLASFMGLTIRFTPSDCFETLPKPHDIANEELKRVGADYHLHRSRLMTIRGDGLTQIYNHFHSPNEQDVEINLLREKQRAIDFAVLNAYGWSDIDLCHDFYGVLYLPENDNQRYTISEAARIETLRRLAELNRQRYQAETSQGLHGEKPKKSKVPVARKKKPAGAEQPSFDFGVEATSSVSIQMAKEVVNQWGSTAHDQILAWLEAHVGWFPKAVILTGSGTDPSVFDSTIGELIKDGFVEGHADNSRYRAKL